MIKKHFSKGDLRTSPTPVSDITGREEFNDRHRCWGCAQVTFGEMIDYDQETFEKFRLDQYQEPLRSEGITRASSDTKKGLAYEAAKDDYKKYWHATVEQQWEDSLNLFRLNKDLWIGANEIKKKLNIEKEESETLLVRLRIKSLRILEESLVNLLKEMKRNGEAIDSKQIIDTLDGRVGSLVQDDLSYAKDVYENLEEQRKKDFRKKV